MRHLCWATIVIVCSIIISIGIAEIRIDKSIGISVGSGAHSFTLSDLNLTRIKDADWKVSPKKEVFLNEVLKP